MQKKILSISLSVLLGITFIFSGIIKLYPIEPFELTFVDVGVANWTFAPYLARIVIAFEVFLGVLLLLNLRLKTFTLKATTGLLVFFTFYLLYEIITKGNNGNCGCFGTFLKMTPLQSIIKNIFLLLMVWLLHLTTETNGWSKRWIVPVLAIVSLATPFILYPLDWVYYQSIDTGFVGKKLNFEKVRSTNNALKNTQLSAGKQVVAFFTLGCPHCKIAARKLSIIQKKMPELPLTVVFMGATTNMTNKFIAGFFEETDSRFPFMVCEEDDFLKLSGPYLPSIYYLNEGVVIKRWGNLEINPDELKVAL